MHELISSKIIFSKTYDWSHLDGDENRKAERKTLLISLMREKKSLQRLDHPFIVSYLGFVQLEQRKSKYSLYLEYCDGGDLETRHVSRIQPDERTVSDDEEEEELLAEAGIQDSSDTNKPDEEPPSSTNAADRRALNEHAVWTLMYQLFAALAYLHYGISISKEGACRVEHHWDTMLHRDIKPHNIVLKFGLNGQRIAKLCDLGHVRNWKAAGPMTVPTYRGTREYWPPEIKGACLTLEERHHQWSTKGDVWCLAKSLIEVEKDFSLGAGMKEVFDGCSAELPEKRWSSLSALERIHQYRHFLYEPFTSFEQLLGGKPLGYEYQAFVQIAPILDTFAPYTQVTKTQRKKLLDRLLLLLKDGPGAMHTFQTHSRSLHLAVLLNEEDLLRRLLSSDGQQNPDEPWQNSKWTALHLAVQQKKLEFVELLLRAGADVNVEDVHKMKPLFYAIQEGYSDIEWRLLSPTKERLSQPSVSLSTSKQNVRRILQMVRVMEAYRPRQMWIKHRIRGTRFPWRTKRSMAAALCLA
ncbi:kinase-like domain-containing protein [Clohesyomyces aquaticus]|uniref:non-specific serine/threonine protein kinase n=1 Tax=Clohesyomyces aquaticus TaxID=1231657 RepID=A0A1Y1ZYN7_9PLEO|nr:kinase-like domain-containing protein [Clohesyomyces aquaticus]